MISRRYIAEWKGNAPWQNDAQIEQDLIIERALNEMFSDDLIRKSLALRGGTALHKIFLKPQARYSEDIDLVQINPEPIQPVLKRVREKLIFLGQKRTVNQKANNNTIIYRFESEIPPIIPMRLKIEINCREHITVLGHKEIIHKMNNTWYSGESKIASYELDELLGTKLRALYQRKKGRDLFDLYWAMQQHDVNPDRIIKCYKEYMRFVVGKPPTKKLFLLNIEEKMNDSEFMNDIYGLLRTGIEYDNQKAYKFLMKNIFEKL